MGFRPRGREKKFPIPVEGDWKISRANRKCAKRLGLPQTNLPIPRHNNFTATGNANGCWAFAIWALDVLFGVHAISYRGATAPLTDVPRCWVGTQNSRSGLFNPGGCQPPGLKSPDRLLCCFPLRAQAQGIQVFNV